MSGTQPALSSPAWDDVGAAGEAAVLARLLLEGFRMARPVVDRGVDLVVLSRDAERAVPLQIKAVRTPRLHFRRAWFEPVDVVLVLAWLDDPHHRFFVFDGIAGVEAFLGQSAERPTWRSRGIWDITSPGPSHQARLAPFEGAFDVIRRRLSAPPPLPAARRPYRLTRHARERVEAGEVQEAWIAETLSDPDRRAPNPRRPGITLSWRRIPAFGGRVLRVAHRPDEDQICVVTAFFDRGAAP
jgi:hypothetical protein